MHLLLIRYAAFKKTLDYLSFYTFHCLFFLSFLCQKINTYLPIYLLNEDQNDLY